MSEITTTEAAWSFADLLDAVEHRGELMTIIRRGKTFASLEPVNEGHGADSKVAVDRAYRELRVVKLLAV
ncbi:MAG TPA: hypothetical protein VHT30_04455 [Acidimicrobiales bacterium]|nr:hypothetical protein [Acidimicrobiales bacterium]